MGCGRHVNQSTTAHLWVPLEPATGQPFRRFREAAVGACGAGVLDCLNASAHKELLIMVRFLTTQTLALAMLVAPPSTIRRERQELYLSRVGRLHRVRF